MLITDKFVMLNNPKTGSSFAREAIKDIYKNKLNGNGIWKVLHIFGFKRTPFIRELMLPNIRVTEVEKQINPHGTYSQIPIKYRDRTIVSIVRNPYSRLLSGYEFGWWAKHPNLPELLLKQNFPSFPNLTLDEYIRMREMDVANRLGDGALCKNIGLGTINFIQMFYKNPSEVLSKITDDYLDSDDVFDDMPDIYFLRQECLNDDLANFLENLGFSWEEVNYVRSKGKVNVTKKGKQDRKSLWTKSAIAYVRDKERMIFRILESKGINYKAPDPNCLNI